MKHNSFISRTISLFAVALMLCSTLFSTALAAESDIVNPNASTSLTMYKYDLTAAAQGNVNVSSFTANGERDEAAEAALKPYALQGVQYDYAYVGDMMTYSNAGTVKVVYSVPTTLRNLLNMPTSEAVTNKDGLYYYTSDQYNDALADLLTANTEGKNKLEDWAAQNGAKPMAKTDSTGMTTKTNLKQGLYIIIETAVPEEVFSTTDPFFVCLPMTDATGDYWVYDVTVYPKNQTNNPTLDKLVSENGTYADTATVSEGDVIDYRLVSQLPTITSAATALSQYEFVDTISKGLMYNEDVVISFYDDEDHAKQNTGTPEAVWTAKANPTLFSTSYEKLAGGSRMTVTIKEDGLKEINKFVKGSNYSKLSDKYIVVSYTVSVTSDADMVLGDTGNINDAELTYSRTSTSYHNTIRDRAIVYTYGIELDKTFSDNKGDATAVRFILKNDSDEYFVTAKGSNGVYYVTGQSTDEKNGTVFSPNESGKLLINGLEADSYTLTEIGTDKGYSLLKDDISIEFTATETKIIPSVAAVTGIGSSHPNVTVEKTDASVAVDGENTAMSADTEDTDSKNAMVLVSILNSRTFLLPQTGGNGIWAITIAGVVGIACGGLFLILSRRKPK